MLLNGLVLALFLVECCLDETVSSVEKGHWVEVDLKETLCTKSGKG